MAQKIYYSGVYEQHNKLISFAANSVDTMQKYDVEVIYELDSISITEIEQENHLVDDAYTTIHKCIFEYKNQLPGRDLALQYLVRMLLLRIYRLNHSNQTVIHTLNNADRNTFRNFKKLVQETKASKNGWKITRRNSAFRCSSSASSAKLCPENV